MLATAGLLDGCRAMTHWQHASALARAYPAIDVEPDAIFVEESTVFCSAGVSAGIDLALALVERELGPRAGPGQGRRATAAASSVSACVRS